MWPNKLWDLCIFFQQNRQNIIFIDSMTTSSEHYCSLRNKEEKVIATIASNKAKIAKRVAEVLEFFDEEHPRATMMDIVRRFNRPQSSTSELLSSLVDLGLLYKEPCLRSYSPTPRAAMLSNAVQPEILRDGLLLAMMERLSVPTGLGVAVFDMVGHKVQIFCWRPAKRTLRTATAAGFCGGQQEYLSDTAAGQLLLSTVAQPRRDGMIRRLNADAAPEAKFNPAEMAVRVLECRELGHKRPWEYFRDHFACTFWFEKVAPKLLLETIGVDNVMFENDFPHPTSLYPDVQAHIVDVLGGYDFATQKKVLQDNAVRFYNLPF
jgi:DNA-binding IclR family transcriptional regulator